MPESFTDTFTDLSGRKASTSSSREGKPSGSVQATLRHEPSSKTGFLKKVAILLLACALAFMLTPSQALASTQASETSKWDASISINDASSQGNARLFSNAPVISAVSAVSATQVNITWGAYSGATSYGVYRQASDERTAIFLGETTALSYADKTATPGKLYLYAVAAKMSNGQTRLSEAKSVATPPKTVKATAKASFPKGAKISWPSAAGATRYYVMRAVKGTNKYSVVQTTTSTSYTDTSAAGKKYIYKVRPVFVMNNRVYSQAADSAGVSTDAGNWKKSGTTKKFVFSNGTTAKGWQLIAGKWYCFTSAGKMMKSAFKTTSGKRYFLASNGVLKKGWFNKSGKRYYSYGTSGLATGWKTISGKRYHFSKKGVLSRNTYINGRHLNSKGVWDGKVKVSSRVGTVKVSRSLLTKVNQARKKVGASTLKWDAGLAETAMKRAIEIRKLFSHTRPNGSSCFTLFPSYLTAAGENIAMGQTSVTAVNTAWTNSPGHYSNMVNSMFNCFGAACFTYNGTKYWVESFGYK